MSKQICMLAHLYDPKRVIFPAYIQPKLDGVRAIWLHKEKKFVSRNNKPLVLPNKLLSSTINIPYDIDGELLIPGKSFNEISGIVRHLDQIPEKLYLEYTIFDIISNEPFLQRYNKIHSNSIIPTIEVDTFDQINSLHNINLLSGYEGSIIRNNAPYEFKRSFNLLKLKPTKEIECKVIGLIEGTGKYEGMLGALTVETPDKKIFNVGSGFIDMQRYMIWNVKSTDHIDKFVIIRYQDLSEYGIPRFPIFKGFKE